MKVARSTIPALLSFGLVMAPAPRAVHAAAFTVSPGESIQAAVDAAPPGSIIKVKPGDYIETHAGTAAVRITKPLKLYGKRNNALGTKARILPGPGQTDGILVEPANPGDPPVNGVKIKGFTVEGFPNNGIWLRYVNDFKIDSNESINNLENGIWPTLSANGLVKKNVSYGSQDSALWIEASENVRVLHNDLHHSPTGLEITVSKNVLAKKNEVHHNSVGIGLYHPNAAGLSPLGGDGYWTIENNHVYDNNEPNSAPPGSMASGLPVGTGILVLGVDHVTVEKNLVENNDFIGIGLVDWCLGAALAGPTFDCNVNPPVVEPLPEYNSFIRNTLVSNGSAPPSGFEPFAADISMLLGPATGNCFSENTPTATLFPPGSPLPPC